MERRPNPADRRSSVVLPVPEGLEETGRHFVPVAGDLLEKTAELTDEEREAVGKYLEAATEVFRRHARDQPRGYPGGAGSYTSWRE